MTTMNQQAFLTQILVKSFLENENKESSIYIYGELVNGMNAFIDVFNREITFVKDNYNRLARGNIERPTIEAFIQSIPDDDYCQSIDVKFAKTMMFKDLFNLVSKVEYPKNISIQLIYVSSDTSLYNQHQFKSIIDEFNETKQKFLEESELKQFYMVNAFKNDNKLQKYQINETFRSVSDRYDKGKLPKSYQNDVNDGFVRMFIENLKKVSIRELTLDELTDNPPTKEQLLEILLENFGVCI